jgi:hypothetical protein
VPAYLFEKAGIQVENISNLLCFYQWLKDKGQARH